MEYQYVVSQIETQDLLEIFGELYGIIWEYIWVLA